MVLSLLNLWRYHSLVFEFWRRKCILIYKLRYFIRWYHYHGERSSEKECIFPLPKSKERRAQKSSYALWAISEAWYIYIYRWQISQNQFIFLLSGMLFWSMLYGPQFNKDDLLFYLVLVTDFSFEHWTIRIQSMLFLVPTGGVELNGKTKKALPSLYFSLDYYSSFCGVKMFWFFSCSLIWK